MIATLRRLAVFQNCLLSNTYPQLAGTEIRALCALPSKRRPDAVYNRALSPSDLYAWIYPVRLSLLDETVRPVQLGKHLLQVFLIWASGSPMSYLRAENLLFDPTTKTMHANVHLVALTSAARQGFAGSQDTYLAILREKGHEEVIRLVDRYPSFDVPMRPSVWRQSDLHVRLRRSNDCDTEAGSLDPVLMHSLQGGIAKGSIPCYIVDHRYTRVASMSKTQSTTP